MKNLKIPALNQNEIKILKTNIYYIGKNFKGESVLLMIMISVLLDISKWQKLTIFSQKKNAERKMFTLRGGNDKTKKMSLGS